MDATASGEENAQVVLDRMNIKDVCCRRMFLTHVDIEQHLLLYPTYPGNIQRVGVLTETQEDEDDE